MKWFVFLMLSTAILLAMNVKADVELLTSGETVQYEKLNSLQWKNSVSDKDIAYVKKSLKKVDKDTIAEIALRVVVLHRIKQLMPVIRRGVGSTDSYSRLLARVILAAWKNGQDPIVRLKHISNEDVPEEVLDECIKRARSIIVVDAARHFRAGNHAAGNANIQDLKLNQFEEQLLKYSRLPQDESVDVILEKLERAEIAGTKEYNLIDILASYEKPNINAVLVNLEKQPNLTKYGKILLLNYLEREVTRMNKKDKHRVQNVLQGLKFDSTGFPRLKEDVLQQVKSGN